MSKAHFQLNSLHRGQTLAVSIPSLDPMNLAWIGVRQLDLSVALNIEFLRNQRQTIPTSSVRVYYIRMVEVLKTLIEQDVWICERDVTNRFKGFAYGDEELEKKLEELGVTMHMLVPEHRSDYPL